MTWQAAYSISLVTDTLVLVVDQNGPRSVTNDAQGVIDRIAADIGGLGMRRVFYRDSAGRFDELRVEAGEFKGFAPCTDHQQEAFTSWSQGSALSEGWG